MAVNTTIQVVMPQMGESVTEGTVLSWFKQEGEEIAADEPLVEISTDKIDAEVPSPGAGTLVKLHVAEGDTVTVGQVLAEIAPSNGASASHDHDNGNGAPAAQEAPETDDAAAGEVLEIVMPQMGESVTEGTILEWAKGPGDTIAVDETIVEISTDKVDAEVPSPASGTITEILAEAGDTVTVGQVLARLQAGAGAAAKVTPDVPGAAPATGVSGTGNGAHVPDGSTVSPVARRMASIEGVDLSRVAGSGPGGRITKADVLAAKGNGGAVIAAAAPAAPTGGEALPIRGGAAMLAKYMDESRSIPTATSFRTLTVTVMDGRRKELKAAGQRVSFTHLIAYAIAQAASEMPVMAHHFAEIDGKPNRIDDGQVNLGLAVDVEKKDGTRTLLVPVIRAADRLSFQEFLDAYNALVDKARTNSLTADDLVGSNISLTNPGGI